jgi:hypothetical protein
MKIVFFTGIFILAFSFIAIGQTQNNSDCPVISITGPESVVQTGETMTFTVNVSGIDSDKIEYQWSVNKGTIIEGLGTSVISVDTSGLDSTTITATVKIKGLPSICSNLVSETAIVAPICILPIALDEFRKLSKNDEKARLYIIVLELQQKGESNALIILYHTPKDNRKTLSKRVERIKNFLVKDNKVPEDRVSIVFGGEEPEERTKIYIVPEGASMPEDFDTKKSLDELDFSPGKNN